MAEHKAVLAAAYTLSRIQKTPLVAVFRSALREYIKRHATEELHAQELRSAVWKLAPKISESMRTRTEVARFKREQREFDRVVLELNLADPNEIEARNSIAHPNYPVRMVNFVQAHAST